MNIPLLDKNLKLLVESNRNITSIKLSISRKMISRINTSLQRILLGTRELHDEELLSDLVNDIFNYDDDNEEEYDDNDNKKKRKQ